MNNRTLAVIVLAAFVLFGVFGLYMPGHGVHTAGCPFAPGSTILCSGTLTHLQNWQAALAAIITYTFVLVGILTLCTYEIARSSGMEPQYQRYRLQRRFPEKPTLFQELFSKGTINRKAP